MHGSIRVTTADTDRHPARHDAAGQKRRPWSLMVLLSVAQFMVILDATVVNVALPSIARSLSFAAGDLQWVITAYVLASGGLVLLGGRAADVAGRRRIFLAGLTVFTAASLASGLAPTAGALIAARAGQGLGAALLAPAALSIITTTYTGAQRATALGVWGALAHGWGSARTLLPLAVAFGLLTAFAVVERSARRPLVPPQIWRTRSLAAGVVVMLGATGILVATFFLNSLYLQEVQHASALRVGLEFLPLAVVIGVGAHVASRLLPRAGSRVLIVAGLVVMGGGALLFTSVSVGSSYLTGFLPGMLVVGAGIGLALPATAVTAMSDIAEDRAGVASGLMTAAHEIGAALGVAVFSAVAVAAGGGIAAGYRHGFMVAAAVAAGLAVVAALAVPAVRPAAGARVAVH